MAAPRAKQKVVKKPPVKPPVKAPAKAKVSPQPRITSDVAGAVVDEIPPARTATARRFRYANVLAEVREKVGPGRAVKIAEFVGRSGATTVKRELVNGLKPVDGSVGEWEFVARRLESGGSVLYATLKHRGQQ